MTDPSSPFHDLPPEATRVAAGRIGRIVLAYGLACVAAGVARTVGLVIEETWVRGFGRLVADNGAASLVIVPVMTALIAFVAAAPFATAFLVWAEGRSARALGLYLVGGAAIGAATQGLVTLPFTGASMSIGLVVLTALAGMVGGWVHWVVAVRSAPPPPRRVAWPEA